MYASEMIFAFDSKEHEDCVPSSKSLLEMSNGHFISPSLNYIEETIVIRKDALKLICTSGKPSEEDKPCLMLYDGS